MKKHEVVLDFTSLLDVILIILFLVLCTMNGKAQKDADKIDNLTQAQITMEAQLTEQTGQIEELTNKNREQAALLEEMEAIKKENERLQAQAEKAEAERNEALSRLDKYMEISGQKPTDIVIYNELKENIKIYELRLVKRNLDDNLCYLSLYYNNSKVGTDTDIDPLPANRDVNVKKVASWLSAQLSLAMATEEKNMVLIEVKYKYNISPNIDVPYSAPLHVTEAIETLEKNRTKGYYLFSTVVEESK